MSTIVYGSGFVELYGTLMTLPSMPVDSWLESCGGTIRFLVDTRQQNYLAGYIYQQVSERGGDKSSIKYFYLMDKLMRTRKSFVPSLQSILIDLYTMVFVTFWQRGFHSSIEQLKILRKLWLGTVNFSVLHNIRHRIMEILATDIDSGFRRETIENIEHYYRNVLKLDDWQVRQHLPTLTQGELDARYNYQPTYQPNNILMPAKKQETEVKRKREYVVEEEKKSRKVRVVEQEGTRKPVPISKPLAVQKPKPVPAKVQQPLQTKISRVDSVLAKLKTLRNLGQFRCQKCGVCFGEQRAYDQHLSFHFQQNLQRYDMKVRRVNVSNRTPSLSLSLWHTHPNQASNSQELLDKYTLTLEKLDQLTLKPFCDFCGDHFRCKLLQTQGTWVYVNCVEVNREAGSSNARKVILHKSCFDVLQPAETTPAQ